MTFIDVLILRTQSYIDVDAIYVLDSSEWIVRKDYILTLSGFCL